MSMSVSGLGSINKGFEVNKKTSVETNKFPEKKQEQLQPVKDKLSSDKASIGKSNPNLSFQDKKQDLINHAPKMAAKTAVVAASIYASKVASAEVAKKTIAKSAGKVIEKGSAIPLKALTKSLSENLISTATVVVTETVAMKAVEKGAVKVGQKSGAKAASRWAAAVPVVGAVVEAGFAISDAKYAYELSKDKSASKMSKVLAWSTVGLDVVSMVCTATGVGSAVGWAATGLSIATGVGSDLTK